MKSNTINKQEIEKFSKMASEWWDPHGKFKPLHKFNPVRIKYIALFYVLLSFMDVTGNNAGGEIAHLGGAIIGYLYIRQLQNGINMGEGIINIINYFSNKKKEIVEEKKYKYEKQKEDVSQDEIDKILDKISKSGYSSLSRGEKEKLFKLSNKK